MSTQGVPIWAIAVAGLIFAFISNGPAQTGLWRDLQPATSPPFRVGHGLGAEPATGLIVAYGGTMAGSSPLDDTWIFDGCTWSQVATPSSPGGRWNAGMGPSPVPGRMVLFGGGIAPQTVVGETWEFDFGTVAWTHMTPPGGPTPSARQQSVLVHDSLRGRTVTGAMAYDPASQHIVLFAGSTGWPIGLNDTWEYDGTNRSPVTIAGVSPMPQYLHLMSSDPARGGVQVYGAYGDNWANLNQTWRFQRASLLANTLTPALGSTVSFTITLPGDAGFAYLAAVGLSGNCPGLGTPGGRFVPLNYDSIVALSLSGLFPQTFQGFTGTLNTAGVAAPGLSIPPLPLLSGAVVSAAAVTFSGTTLGSITNGLDMVIQ